MRRNDQIRISPIRLIDEDNEQVGIVETRDAIQRARDAGMDLVEVAPQSRPPVCRIMDYGKFRYAQRKKEQKAKAHRHETELKQIRIRTPKIGDHDLGIKVKHAREFLERGDRVQFSLRFRGRELAHIDEGLKVFQRIVEELSDVSKIDQHSRREGRRISMSLAPTAVKPPTKPKDDAKHKDEPKDETKPEPVAKPKEEPVAEPKVEAVPEAQAAAEGETAS